MKPRQMCVLLLAAIAVGCQKSPQAVESKDGAAPAGPKVIAMQVTQDGFVPARLQVKKGEPLELKVTRMTNDTCATELIIEGTDINTPLPYKEEVTIKWTPDKTGAIKYGCHMQMMISGVLLVE